MGKLWTNLLLNLGIDLIFCCLKTILGCTLGILQTVYQPFHCHSTAWNRLHFATSHPVRDESSRLRSR